MMVDGGAGGQNDFYCPGRSNERTIRRKSELSVDTMKRTWNIFDIRKLYPRTWNGRMVLVAVRRMTVKTVES